jgi:hypothetical protein
MPPCGMSWPATLEVKTQLARSILSGRLWLRHICVNKTLPPPPGLDLSAATAEAWEETVRRCSGGGSDSPGTPSHVGTPLPGPLFRAARPLPHSDLLRRRTLVLHSQFARSCIHVLPIILSRPRKNSRWGGTAAKRGHGCSQDLNVEARAIQVCVFYIATPVRWSACAVVRWFR